MVLVLNMLIVRNIENRENREILCKFCAQLKYIILILNEANVNLKEHL